MRCSTLSILFSSSTQRCALERFHVFNTVDHTTAEFQEPRPVPTPTSQRPRADFPACYQLRLVQTSFSHLRLLSRAPYWRRATKASDKMIFKSESYQPLGEFCLFDRAQRRLDIRPIPSGHKSNPHPGMRHAATPARLGRQGGTTGRQPAPVSCPGMTAAGLHRSGGSSPMTDRDAILSVSTPRTFSGDPCGLPTGRFRPLPSGCGNRARCVRQSQPARRYRHPRVA